EKELLHFVFEELAGLRLDRREPVFVDQHGLVLEPALPRELRHVLVDPHAERARIRRAVEPFGFGAEHHAIDHSTHAICLVPSCSAAVESASAASSAATGAGMPSAVSPSALYQTRSGR